MTLVTKAGKTKVAVSLEPSMKALASAVFRALAERRWKATPPEERSTAASKAARARWKGVSAEERSEHMRHAVKARWRKRR